MRILTYLSFIVLLGCLMSCQATSGSTKSTNWVFLGEKTVNKKADRDELMVTAAKGAFRKIKFVCRKAPIQLLSVRIVYGNGTDTKIPVGKRIKPGTESPAFDLPGDQRIIKKVIFNYRTAPRSTDRAVVKVWAKR